MAVLFLDRDGHLVGQLLAPPVGPGLTLLLGNLGNRFLDSEYNQNSCPVPVLGHVNI